MIVDNINNIEGKIVESPLAQFASMKVLVGESEGWEDYVMRELEVGVGGFTPKHSHDWPHINYIISGDGELLIGEKVNKITAGSFAFVPSKTIHQFKNVGNELFKFICIVPKKGHK